MTATTTPDDLYVLDGQDPAEQRKVALAIAADAARAGRDVLILGDRGHGIGSTDADERELARLLTTAERERVTYLPIDDARGRALWRLGDARSAGLIGSLTEPLVVVLGSAWLIHERESLDNLKTLTRVVREQAALARELGSETVLVHPLHPGALPEVPRANAVQDLQIAGTVAAMADQIVSAVREVAPESIAVRQLVAMLGLDVDEKGSAGATFSRALTAALESGRVVRIERGRYAAGRKDGRP